MTLWGAVFGVSVVLCLSSACSRQEKPKAVEKKPRTIEIAPTPIPSTGMVRIVRKVDTNSPHYRAPQSAESTPESRKELREKQKAFSRKILQREMDRCKGNLDTVDMEIAKTHENLIKTDSSVSNAYQDRTSAISTYEATCVQYIPEYSGLMEKIKTAENAVQKLIENRQDNKATDSSEIHKLTETLSQLMSERADLLRKTLITCPEARDAYQSVTKTETQYRQALDQSADFQELTQKRQRAQSEYNDLIVQAQGLEQEK